MRIGIIFTGLFLAISLTLNGQYNKIIVVKAHTKVSDYFTAKDQYLYKDFLPGRVVFKNGLVQDLNLNYNILYGAIEFIKDNDTLAISKKKDIEYVVVQDTFYYDQGPVEIISGGRIKVGLRDYYKVKDIVKEGPYGSNLRSASADSYESISAYGNLYNLVPNETIELQRTLEYYLITPGEGFTLFNRKKILALFPGKSDEIKAYIKSHKVNFESRDDLLSFADFLRTL